MDMELKDYTNDAVELLKALIATPSVSRNETRAADLMTGAPGVVDDKQLDELSIQNTRKEEN